MRIQRAGYRVVSPRARVIRADMDYSGVIPPQSIEVVSTEQPLFYLPDGTAIVRTIGFSGWGEDA